MPYASTSALPAAVKDALPTGRLRQAWLKAFNAAFAEYKDDKKAFATAWATIGKIATKGRDGKWTVKAGKEKPAKKSSPFALLAKFFGADEGEPDPQAAEPANDPEPIGKREPVELEAGAVSILKMDEEQRTVLAWSTVISVGGKPLLDLQKHYIDADEMVKAYHRYAMEERLGNDMHTGPDTSVLVEGFCFTKERQDLLKIDLGMEGYLGVWKILDDDVWTKLKAGERPMMSIEGTAVLVDVEDAA